MEIGNCIIRNLFVNLTLAGGRRDFVTPLDIKMKFFEFDLTPLGVILQMSAAMETFFINYECVVEWNGKVKKLTYLAEYLLYLPQIRYREIFWMLTPKPTMISFLYDVILMSKRLKVKYLYIRRKIDTVVTLSLSTKGAGSH